MHLVHPPPPCPPPLPQILHHHCFQFVLGIKVAPRDRTQWLYNFFFRGWEGGKVHYGLCDNGELKYRDMNEGKNISDTLVVLTTNILTSSVIYY